LIVAAPAPAAAAAEAAGAKAAHTFRINAVLAAVCAAAFGLRVLRLDSQSLWDNETHPVYMARRGLLYILQHLEADHTPIHFALLAGWGRLGGWSEFSVRYLSLVAGVLTVPLVYQIVRRVAPRQAALVATAALAVAAFHVYYSQETRLYALACLFVTLAAYALMVAWQRDSKRHWALYALAAAAALNTFYYTGLALIAMNVPLLVGRRKPAGWWLANLAGAAAILPWLVLVLPRFERFLGDRVALAGPAPFGPMDVLQQPAYLAFGSTVDMRWVLVPGLLLALLAVGCAVVLLSGGRTLDRVLASWGLGMVICLDLLVIGLPIYDPRYLLESLPGWLCLIVVALARKPALRRLGPPAAAVFVAGCGLALYNNYFNGVFQRPDYRDAFAVVRAQSSPNDLLVYDTPFQPWAPDYYFRDQPIPAVGLPDIRAQDGSTPDLAELSGRPDWSATEADMAADSAHYDGIWLLLYGQPNTDPENRVEDWLDEHRLAVSNNWINGVRLKHYLPAPRPVAGASLPDGMRLNMAFGPLRLLQAQVGQPTADHRLGVRLLWTPAEPLRVAYSASLQLFDPGGRRVAQRDGPLLWGGLDLSAWQQGTAYFDSASLALPAALPKGLYQLRLSVYDANQRAAGEQRAIATVGISSAALVAHPDAAANAGWTLQTVEVGQDASGRLLVALTSHVDAAPPRNFTWFVHLLDTKGMLLGQDDHPPLTPTSAWRPGEEPVDWFSLRPGAGDGAELEIGAYDATGQRVSFRSSSGAVADRVLVPLAGTIPQ